MQEVSTTFIQASLIGLYPDVLTNVMFCIFSIKWLKEGKEYLTLPGKSSTTEIRELERVTSKLKIVDSEKDDAGRYSCQATNAFGSSHFTVDVTIWGKKPLKFT